VLDGTLFEHVNAIFGAPVLAGPGQYVLAGQGTRSLDTIRPQRLVKVIYEQSPGGSWRYRVGFTDGSGTTYWLTVTDLAWRYYCDTQRRQGLPIQEIASHLTSVVSSGAVYLCAGLARGWEKYPDRCYLQLTAVHTFPDYLGGRTFADLAPCSTITQRKTG